MPPPTPTPVPAPSPPQTIMVNLPPELLHKLAAPDNHWWAQPAATLGAALIALIAAVVALSGVWLQLSRTHKSDRRAALAEAYASAWELLRTFSTLRTALMDSDRATEYAKAYTRALTATGQLIVLGKMDRTAEAMQQLTTSATEAVKTPPMGDDVTPLLALVETVEETIKRAKV